MAISAAFSPEHLANLDGADPVVGAASAKVGDVAGELDDGTLVLPVLVMKMVLPGGMRIEEMRSFQSQPTKKMSLADEKDSPVKLMCS